MPVDTSNPLNQDFQSSDVGTIVHLFDVDASDIDPAAPTYYFTPMTDTAGTTEIVWRGNTYTPIPVEATGFGASAKGALPTPRFRVSTVNFTQLITVVRTYRDLVGAWVTRWRTLDKYLDGRPGANPNAYFRTDQYVIAQKIHMSREYIEWELAALGDVEGVKFPKRQFLRDYCTHTYRRYVGTPPSDPFTYVGTTCPYVAQAYWTSAGVNTLDASLDKCGKTIRDCALRFQDVEDALPTRAFPGIAKTRLYR